jgi:hypothetical protein
MEIVFSSRNQRESTEGFNISINYKGNITNSMEQSPGEADSS